MKKFDFLHEYLESMLKNNKFAVADYQKHFSNVEFQNIVHNITSEILKKKGDSQLCIVILLDRNVNYIASMFAAWYADSYFIPLNTKWPKERLELIIDHCNADIVICSKNGDYHKKNSFYIENLDCGTKKTQINTCLSKPTDLAYIIYTSGSTGTPKGVMITNESYLKYVQWTSRFFTKYSHCKSLLLTSELTFDITMGDIAFALSFDSSIVISPDPKNIISHVKLINKYNIETLYSVPTTHNAIFNFVKKKKNINIDSIKLVMSGGDSFSVELIKIIKDALPNAEFYNVYGPTEVTINCFATRVDNLIAKIEESKLVPIGNPFDIIEAVIINDNNEDVTNKIEVGRLFVSGPQIMLGYLNDSDKTNNTFVLDPRYPAFKKKLYDTGDLAIKRQDGLFYLLGRSDDIVKIKGYRINPTEVNNIILKYKCVNESIVFAAKCGDSYKLINCFSLISEINLEDLRIHILRYLPDYMLPSEYFTLNQMPLNNSGKIDKRLLKIKYENGELE